ncbi:methionyl-tRNA formyltransferase [Bacteroidia bacterium]|nr:methionyl-tRNA formyltransferase [Bacteroidia bacterium]
MRIVFMGTPQIAAYALHYLHEQAFNIVGVVTNPDKPAGRGKQLHQSAVKLMATQLDIPVLQPERLTDPQFLTDLQNFNADIQVVLAFRMLPKSVFSMPAMGTINLHTSLLPDYRGAAPINHVIINGEQESGVTTFLLNETMDGGDLLLQQKLTLSPDETAGSLHDKLAIIGAQLLTETLHGIANNQLVPIKQPIHTEQVLHSAPKIFKADCEIDWTLPAHKVLQCIRGLSPTPTAFARLSDQLNLKIFQAEKALDVQQTASAGTIYTNQKNLLRVCCGDAQWLQLSEVQVSNKQRMPVDVFLRGFSFEAFSHFLPKSYAN